MTSPLIAGETSFSSGANTGSTTKKVHPLLKTPNANSSPPRPRSSNIRGSASQPNTSSLKRNNPRCDYCKTSVRTCETKTGCIRCEACKDKHRKCFFGGRESPNTPGVLTRPSTSIQTGAYVKYSQTWVEEELRSSSKRHE